MPLMESPYAGKPVDVPDALVDSYLASGFTVVKSEPDEKKPAPKRRSSK